MELSKHIKKLAKLRIRLSLNKPLWEWERERVRLWGKGP